MTASPAFTTSGRGAAEGLRNRRNSGVTVSPALVANGNAAAHWPRDSAAATTEIIA